MTNGRCSEHHLNKSNCPKKSKTVLVYFKANHIESSLNNNVILWVKTDISESSSSR
jgi:hypothetical protein